MSWLKRRYQKFCYDCSWRYPRLHQFAAKVKFPVQVCALCFALISFVNFYQNNYSFEATMRAHQSRAPVVDMAASSDLLKKTPISTPEPQPFFKQVTAIDPVSFGVKKPVAPPKNSAKLQEQVLLAEQSLREQVRKAELALATKAREAEILRNKIGIARALLDAEEKRTESLKSLPSTSQGQDSLILLNGRWIRKQQTDNYIIQLASSTENTELIHYAQTFSSHGPLAIYPFKTTKEGKLLYGLSAGLYNSSTEATTAAALLPVDTSQHGSWVRKIADVSSQIAAYQKHN